MKVWNAERTVKKSVFDVQSFKDLLKKGALYIVFVTTCKVLFGDISIVPLLIGSSLGIFDSNVQPGMGKFGSI